MYFYKESRWSKFKRKSKSFGNWLLEVIDFIVSDIIWNFIFKGFFRLIGWVFRGIGKMLKLLIESIFD
ncbi:hypothetical protein BK730_22065 [Bacillus wiedmannii]|uniref:Uncharacterized protein n=1 Tax=Bacillus wiedmannii TaxID=1890302 RepID=A0A242Z0S6_9BACI|nr:hypothetical protein BK730_22065 [Bacillus wiedmannii]